MDEPKPLPTYPKNTEATPTKLDQETKLFQMVMRTWMIVFGIAGFSFLLFGKEILQLGNFIGSLMGNFPAMPESTENFWLSLTMSMMMTITALCYYIQKDVVQNQMLTSFVLISKLVSTITFLGQYFLHQPYFNYLLGSIFCDGPIFIIIFYFYRRFQLAQIPPLYEKK